MVLPDIVLQDMQYEYYQDTSKNVKSSQIWINWKSPLFLSASSGMQATGMYPDRFIIVVKGRWRHRVSCITCMLFCYWTRFINAFWISVAISKASGPSEITHPSLVLDSASRHTGHVLWSTFHCSIQMRQYEWAHGKIVSERQEQYTNVTKGKYGDIF